MRLAQLSREFSNGGKAGGILLVVCAAVSLALANSSFQGRYCHVWHLQLVGHSLTHWINEGLMAIFFLLIGLELKREVFRGQFSSLRNALLPTFGAIGGILVPMSLYLAFNHGRPTQDGVGIPIATDIAFAIGVLSLLGKRVPAGLQVFLTALAVIDDLGAITIIALFYTTGLAVTFLLIAHGIFGFLLVLNRLKVYNVIPYLAGGIAMWYFMLHSGIHPIITGVLLAFATPFKDGRNHSPACLLEHWLHKPVTFVILPLFALANTCIRLDGAWTSGLTQPGSIGIFTGLVIGKPLGIFLFSFIAVSAGLCALPRGVRWPHILGTGFLGGIGFTMAIFISLLAFDDVELINQSILSIMLASFVAGMIGYGLLRLTLARNS